MELAHLLIHHVLLLAGLHRILQVAKRALVVRLCHNWLLRTEIIPLAKYYRRIIGRQRGIQHILLLDFLIISIDLKLLPVVQTLLPQFLNPEILAVQLVEGLL